MSISELSTITSLTAIFPSFLSFTLSIPGSLYSSPRFIVISFPPFNFITGPSLSVDDLNTPHCKYVI